MEHSEAILRLGVVIDGNSRFMKELLDDWKRHFQIEFFEFKRLRVPVLEGRLNDLRYQTSLRRFLSRNDVVFFEWAGSHLAAASRLGPPTPLVARLHSWELFEYASQVEWNKVSSIILVSRAMQREFCAGFARHSSKTKVIYPGKSLPAVAPGTRRFQGRIGLLCDLVPVKRVYEMLFTLRDLRVAGYDLTLQIGGRPGTGAENRRYLASLQRAMERLNVTQHVTFHGWIDEAAEWLEQIDVFVSNSYWEGLQNALLEAMSAGCYCLAHRWNGSEEVLEDSYLYESPRELHEKIAAFCDRPEAEQWAHQSEYRETIAGKFSLDNMLSATRNVIEDARHEPAYKKSYLNLYRSAAE